MMKKRMFKMAVVSAVGTILLAAAPAAVETTQLHPFTNIIEIPVGSDLSSIRFESIKAVKVATTRTSITDQGYCEGGYREPGGSMYCPYIQDGSAMPAYRITYSYNGPPLGSDEYGNAYFTFSVIVRSIDVSPAVLQMMTASKVNRAAAAEDFKVATYPGSVPRVVIDQANSVFCDGSYIDGLWTHTDRNCEDKVTLKTVATPSDYFTVRVGPAASTANLSSASNAN
jgi:hypothetical protein